MPRGHVARQRGGRRRVLSAINAKVVWLYGPCIRLGLLAYVTGHTPRGSSGPSLEREALGKAWTRAGTRPLPMSGSSLSWDLVKTRTLLGEPGAYSRDLACPPGSPGPVRTGVRCPLEVQTHRCTSGCIIFPCHVVPLVLPMWWGREPLSV
jgi:hypothetical protein